MLRCDCFETLYFAFRNATFVIRNVYKYVVYKEKFQCHIILQKSFEYADLLLKKHFSLLLMLKKTVLLLNIFVKTIPLVLSSLLRINWSVNPSLVLNDDSGLCISSMQKRMLFAGFTAAKKTIIQNWFTPHMCRKTYWIRSLLQIVTCECTTARVGGARPSTIDAWQCFLFDIRDCIKELLVLCFYCPSLSPSLFWMLCYV